MFSTSCKSGHHADLYAATSLSHADLSSPKPASKSCRIEGTKIFIKIARSNGNAPRLLSKKPVSKTSGSIYQSSVVRVSTVEQDSQKVKKVARSAEGSFFNPLSNPLRGPLSEAERLCLFLSELEKENEALDDGVLDDGASCASGFSCYSNISMGVDF